MDPGSSGSPRQRREGEGPSGGYKPQGEPQGASEDQNFNAYVSQSMNDADDYPPEEHHEQKIQLFVGGLPSQVTEKILYDHFSQYGNLVECRLVLDKNTLKSRGFGFVSFQNNQALRVVTQMTHKLCGKEVECKQALSKQDSNQRVNEEKSKKVFVGGLPLEATENDLYEYFKKFGEIKACRIIYKHESSISRGFGFVIFGTKEIADEVLMKKDQHYIKGVWVDCKSAILRREMEVMNLMNKATMQNSNMNMIASSNPHSPVHRPAMRTAASSYQDVPETYYQGGGQGSQRGKNWSSYTNSSSSSRGGYHQHHPRQMNSNYDYSGDTGSPNHRMAYDRHEYDQHVDYRYNDYGGQQRAPPGAFNFGPNYVARGRGPQNPGMHGHYQGSGVGMPQPNPSMKMRGNPAARVGAQGRMHQQHSTVPIEHHYVPVHEGHMSPQGRQSPQHASPRRQASPERVESPGNISPTGYYNTFAGIAPSGVFYVGAPNNNPGASGMSPRRPSDHRDSFSPVRASQTVPVEMGYPNQISPRHNRNMNEGRIPVIPGEMGYNIPIPVTNMPIPTMPREQSPKRPFYSPLGPVSPGKQPSMGVMGKKDGNISPGGIGTIPGNLANARGISPQQPRAQPQGKINLKLIDDQNHGEAEQGDHYGQLIDHHGDQDHEHHGYGNMQHHQVDQNYDYEGNQPKTGFQLMPQGEEAGDDDETQGGYRNFFGGHQSISPGYKPGEVSSSTNSPKHVEYKKYFSPTQRGREPRAPNYPKPFKIRQGQQGGLGASN